MLYMWTNNVQIKIIISQPLWSGVGQRRAGVREAGDGAGVGGDLEHGAGDEGGIPRLPPFPPKPGAPLFSLPTSERKWSELTKIKNS